MSDFTAYVENQIVDWMSQGVDPATAPASLYVALHTSDPGNSPDGSTEVGASDYSRVQTAAGSDWDVAGNAPRTFQNASVIEFSTASSNWGTISHATLWDAADSTGNAISVHPVSSPKEIADGDRAEFPAGDLSFDVD